MDRNWRSFLILCQTFFPDLASFIPFMNVTFPLPRITIFCSMKFFLFFFSLCLLFMAAPVAFGSSQARGQIRAIAACLCQSHGNARSEPHLRMTPGIKPASSWTLPWVPNPLSYSGNSSIHYIFLPLNVYAYSPSHLECLPVSCWGSNPTHLYRQLIIT